MLDKRYNEIVLDIKTNKATFPRMTFTKVDEETSDFYIQVNREGVTIDLTGCEITIYVQKPNGNVECKVAEYDSELGLVYCNLGQNMKNIEGKYFADLLIVSGDEKIATPRFCYRVVNDVSSAFIENVDEEELTTLQQLIEDVQLAGGANIDDENVSETSTYSSSKIEELVQNVDIGGINVPTKTSDLENDSGFLTSIPNEYITETELDNKGYLTEHQDISNLVSKDYVDTAIEGVDVTEQLKDYAQKTDLHSHSNKTILDGITSAKITAWDSKSTFSGNYNDLTNKPTIPTITNDLTNTLKSNYDNAYTHSTSTHAPSNAQKNSDITKAEIEAKLTGAITSHTHNYLTTIPSEYVTDSELDSKGYLTQHQDISSKLDKNLGTENAGKMLVVGSDGNIIVMDIPSGEGVFGDITGTVDENNNILLVGDLTDGTYVLKYENKDGTYSNVGTLVISTIEDDNSEVVEGNLFNLETTKINTRVNSSGLEKTQNGVWVTDLIPLDITIHDTIYIKNAIMVRDVGTAPSPVVSFFGESGAFLGQIQCNAANGGYTNYTEVLGDRYTRIKLNTAYTTENAWWSSVKFMRIAGVEDESGAEITKDSIADVIIKLNEEII